jgi:hypothetical protein
MGQISVWDLWIEPPAMVRLLSIFVFLAVCVVLVRIIRLAWRLLSVRRSGELFSDETNTIDEMAEAVLKGLFKREPTICKNENLSKVKRIDTKFRYLWETCSVMNQSTRKLAFLVAILSFPVAVLGCINICDVVRAEEEVGGAAVAGNLAEVLMYLADGLFVSSFFYVISYVFEGILARRRRDWNYLKVRFQEEFSSTG